MRSPPARGSTALPPLALGMNAAFPARAGINRSSESCCWSWPCVPRPRGDQPPASSMRTAMRWRSPPARGSTAGCIRRASCRHAFPARAGINRPPPRRSQRSSGVPRPRGDQPLPGDPNHEHVWRSPPARGSTVRGAQRRGHWQAFPARAGINRRRGSCERFAWCVPRPRGDQPLRRNCASPARSRSPPARGSTVSTLLKDTSGMAFPARAGINRAESPARPPTLRVPRPRGDQPYQAAKELGWDVAFPARAGINRAAPAWAGVGSSVPRPRGDQPQVERLREQVALRSPPARGSTGVAGRVGRRAAAFPARAGINRGTGSPLA